MNTLRLPTFAFCFYGFSLFSILCCAHPAVNSTENFRDIVLSKAITFTRVPVDLPEEIVLDTVQRCRSCFVSCRTTLTRSEYGVFGENGMSSLFQRKLFISQINKPPTEQTKNIVFVIAGQQFQERGLSNILDLISIDTDLDGQSNGITGQRKGYGAPFKRAVGSRRVGIDSSNIAAEIMNEGYFDPQDTFIGSVFDARFNYEYSREEKDNHFNGYYAYLRSRLGANVGTIYLAGHSRGGCLAMRLAQRFTSEFPKARVIVHNWDGVCSHNLFFVKSEFGVSDSTRRTNPLNAKYYVHTTDMNRQFPNNNCLAIRSFLSGEDVVLDQVRAFGHRDFDGVEDGLTNSRGFTWYKQSFHNIGHNSIDSSNHDTAVRHFRESFENLYVNCRS